MTTHLQFIEVVKVYNGEFVHPQPHIERVAQTTIRFFSRPLKLVLTNSLIPPNMRHGVVKCRIVYNSKVISIEFEPYTARDIKTLALIESHSIDYRYKYLNRNAINRLWAQRNGCDDILIVKNSLITDTSFTNVVLKDLEGNLYTPTSTLLPGLKRQELLEREVVREKRISVHELQEYKGIYLINTMLDIEEAPYVEIESVVRK